MKKIFAVLALCLMISGASFAKEIDRKLIKNTTVAEVETIVLDVIKQYEGVVTPKDIDKNKHMYVVDYNKHTVLSLIGISNSNWSSNKYAQAAFSCNLKQQGDDVLMTMRKHSYAGGIFGISTFNHYKKVYNELKFNGLQVVKIK